MLVRITGTQIRQAFYNNVALSLARGLRKEKNPRTRAKLARLVNVLGVNPRCDVEERLLKIERDGIRMETAGILHAGR